MPHAPLERTAAALQRRIKAAPPLPCRLLLCIFQVLLLFLHIAAAQSSTFNVTTTLDTVNAKEEKVSIVAVSQSVVLERCYPDLVVYGAEVTYDCEVSDQRALENLELQASFFKNGVFQGGWPATLLGPGKNIVSFVSKTLAVSSKLDLAITHYVEALPPQHTPLTTTLEMEFVGLSETEVNFRIPAPYYGLTVDAAATLPNGEHPSSYFLVRDTADACQHIGEVCRAENGCYNITETGRLPLPGSYYFCVTVTRWNNHYVPWGHSWIWLRLLVANPYYLVRGAVPSIAMDNGFGNQEKIFLMPCPANNCLNASLTRVGETILHTDACLAPPVSQRLYLSDDAVLSANEGLYAVCVDRGVKGGVSPAALPISVVEKDFSFSAVANTSKLATIYVSEGDLAWRRNPYTLCAVPFNVSCRAASTTKHLCVTSASAREPYVVMNFSSVELTVYDVMFCMVAVNATIFGLFHTWVVEAADLSWRSYLSDFERRATPELLLWIVVGGLLVILVEILFLLHFMSKDWKKEEEGYRKGRSNDGKKVVRSEPNAVTNPLAAPDAAPSPECQVRNPSEVVDASPPFRPPPLDRSRREEFNAALLAGDQDKISAILGHPSNFRPLTLEERLALLPDDPPIMHMGCT